MAIGAHLLSLFILPRSVLTLDVVESLTLALQDFLKFVHVLEVTVAICGDGVSSHSLADSLTTRAGASAEVALDLLDLLLKVGVEVALVQCRRLCIAVVRRRIQSLVHVLSVARLLTIWLHLVPVVGRSARFAEVNGPPGVTSLLVTAASLVLNRRMAIVGEVVRVTVGRRLVLGL